MSYLLLLKNKVIFRQLAFAANYEKPLSQSGLEHLPMTHCTICRFDDERLLLAFASKLLDVVLELSVLRRKDPGFGNEAVFLRLAFNHPESRGG